MSRIGHAGPVGAPAQPGARAWCDALGVLALGTAAVGNLRVPMSDRVATDVLDTAWQAGIRTFDTAPHYGLGLAESRLGRFLAGRARDTFRVSSKAGRRLVDSPATAGRLDDEMYAVPADRRRVWDVSEAGLRAGVEDSLSRGQGA